MDAGTATAFHHHVGPTLVQLLVEFLLHLHFLIREATEIQFQMIFLSFYSHHTSFVNRGILFFLQKVRTLFLKQLLKLHV